MVMKMILEDVLRNDGVNGSGEWPAKGFLFSWISLVLNVRFVMLCAIECRFRDVTSERIHRLTECEYQTTAFLE